MAQFFSDRIENIQEQEDHNGPISLTWVPRVKVDNEDNEWMKFYGPSTTMVMLGASI